jgi:hypothetical protein
MPDSALRARLAKEVLVFLTNDTEFEQLADDVRAQVIISRLRSACPRRSVWTSG